MKNAGIPAGGKPAHQQEINRMRSLRVCAVAAIGFMLAAGTLVAPASAQDALDRILRAHKITIAVQNDVPPYSLLNKDNQLDGFDIEVAKQIAKDLGVEPVFMVVPGGSRIPALVSGRADIVVATLGLTPQRAAAVALSIPYTAFPQVIISQNNEGFHNFADLKDKVVGLTRGTMQDDIVSRMAQGATIRRFPDDATTIQALLSGQIDATTFGSSVAMDLAARNPAKGIKADFTAFQVYASMGVRRQDTDLLHWINTWIFYHKQDGFLQQLHQTWLKIDMPNLPTF
jgi:polar amino acid transport system substrate-binding protein